MGILDRKYSVTNIFCNSFLFIAS